jgi:hypothetical protein
MWRQTGKVRAFVVAGIAAVTAVFAFTPDTASAADMPDLIPIPSRLVSSGVVSVRNAGAGPASAFIVTVQCQKQGGGGCADHPAMRKYTNPQYPGRLVLMAPALPAGHVYNFTLPFWDDLVWAPGNYNFLIEADPAKTVSESDEGNNIYGAVFTP